MKRTKQKLHSCRGASIILALLLLLVATMIAAVIISAAVTAVNRVQDDVKQQRDTLAISSAGKAIVQYLEKDDTYVYHRYEYGSDGGNETVGPYDGESGTTDTVTSVVVKQMANVTGDNGGVSHDPITAEQTITVTLGTDGAELGDRGTATMRFKLDLETEQATQKYYRLSGKIFLGTTETDSSQYLYLTGKLTRSEDTSATTEVSKWIPDEYDKTTDPWTLISPGYPVYPSKTTVTWKLSNIRLTSREEIITGEEAGSP